MEFDHWMRVAQARTDAELRTLVMRGAAGLEVSTRSPGGAARNWCEPVGRCADLARHVIHARFEPSFLESTTASYR